jgi:predicted ATPase
VDRLLERESVLAELTRLVRQVARGAGQMVLLRGEAGVGKSAVIRRFTAGLGAPVRVLWGWCDPLSAPRPLGPLVDMLAGLAGEAAAGLDAGNHQFAIAVRVERPPPLRHELSVVGDVSHSRSHRVGSPVAHR